MNTTKELKILMEPFDFASVRLLITHKYFQKKLNVEKIYKLYVLQLKFLFCECKIHK